MKYMWCPMAERCKSLQAVTNPQEGPIPYPMQEGKFRRHAGYNDGSGPLGNAVCFGSDLASCLKYQPALDCRHPDEGLGAGGAHGGSVLDGRVK